MHFYCIAIDVLQFSAVSSTNKTDCHDITEILLKVALNTIKQTSDMSICVYVINLVSKQHLIYIGDE
jgi:hypothetical protein